MKRPNYALAISAALIVFQFILVQNAYAYLDLGSGSYIFQLIIGALLGVLFSLKVFWTRIKQRLLGLFFGKGRNSKK